MVGSLFFSLPSNSFMHSHPAAVTSAVPTAKVVASESQRRKYTSSKQLQPPKHACSIGTQPKNRKSSSTQITPNSSASSRTAVGRDSSPLSMCPAAPISHISGNVSLFGERFCKATIPRSGSTRHTRTLRCHIFSLCTKPRGLDSPVGTARSKYISKPTVGVCITSKISDVDCATASAFGLCEVIAQRGPRCSLCVHYCSYIILILSRDLCIFGSLRLPIKFYDFKANFSPRRDFFVPAIRGLLTQDVTCHTNCPYGARLLKVVEFSFNASARSRMGK